MEHTALDSSDAPYKFHSGAPSAEHYALALDELTTRIGLNVIDSAWLLETLGDRRWLFTVDDHYVDGGQGERIAAQLLEADARISLRRFGVRGIPECGTFDEALQYHGLDGASLAEAIRREVARGRGVQQARNDRVTWL